MFGRTCYFLFLRGLLGNEQKMDYLTALSIYCLGGYCLNDIRVLNGSQLRVYKDFYVEFELILTGGIDWMLRAYGTLLVPVYTGMCWLKYYEPGNGW